MKEFFECLKDLGLFELLLSSLTVFIPTMGTIYLLGKMLGFLRTPRSKNTVAFISSICFSILQDYILNGSFNGNILERVWNLIVLVGLVILLYVLVGFRLFSRIDSLFDKKIGEDKDNDDKYFPEKKRKINNRGKNDKNN